MLYQLAIYALSQPERVDATILYQILQPWAREASITLRDPVYGTGRAHVLLRPVNMLHLEHLVTSAKTMKHERERTYFARQLAFEYQERDNL